MGRAKPSRIAADFLRTGLIVALAATTALAAQDSKPAVSPLELVRATVANEVEASNHPDLHHLFLSRKQTPKGSQTRIYVETNGALAAMMIALDDQPLNAQQQQQENDHLAGLMNNPGQLRKKEAREKEDEERSLRIVKALPDAFLYEYAGTENSDNRLGKAGDQLVKLTFTPNPSYSPPSHVEQVLTGMQGEVLIDPLTRRLARIDGFLFREVSFGWGIIGHLNKGGRFRVQQADLGLGDGAWGITEVSLNISGKILLIKSISIVSDEVLTDFQLLPAKLTFAQGVEMLKAEQVKLANKGHTTEATEARRDQSN